MGKSKIDFDRAISPCANCAIRSANICSVLLGPDSHPELEHSDWQQHGKVRARRNIKSTGERIDRVYILCDGWAFRFAQLRDGRNQVLSVLLPGDVITPTRLFDDNVRFSVQALTDVRICGYSTALLKERLLAHRVLWDAWANLIVAERQHNLDLLVDLGSRSAEERIAHLILEIKIRLERKGITVGNSFIFPLPQRLFAAATGLSGEHVSRVMTKFREAGLIETSRGHVRVVDFVGLHRMAA